MRELRIDSATSVDLSTDAKFPKLPKTADVYLRYERDSWIFYGRARITSSDRSAEMEMLPLKEGQYRPIIRDGVLDVMISHSARVSVVVLKNGQFSSSPVKGTASIARSDPSSLGTITLSRSAFTSALREAAAKGMDHTSGPSCEEAASCRAVADEIVAAIEAGRFSADDYGYRVEDERRART